MIVPILYLSLLHTGFTVLVLQSGDQLSPPGGAVTLGCRLGSGVGMSSFTMFWYRQNSHAAALEFVAKEYGQSSGSFQTLIDSAKNNFSLLITQLSAKDSSTYYCAAHHNFSLCVNIFQPPFVISREGKAAVRIQCEQDHDHEHMYRYRPSPGRGMQRLAFSHGTGSLSTEAPANTTKFIMSRPAWLKSSLQMQRCITVHQVEHNGSESLSHLTTP
eukprot:XP_011619798.1 PREDICTED: uncharacterized protein LOC105419809 [Takifugu rubripes]